MTDSNTRAEIQTDDGARVLDEKVWQDWIAKSLRREQQAADRRMVAAKWLGIAILTAVAILWKSLSEYDFFIRLGVSLSGLAIFSQALNLRRYAFAAAFAALVLVYNPFVPVFQLSDLVSFVFVLATMLMFAASLIWLRPRSHAPQTAAPSPDVRKALLSSAVSRAL